MGLISATHDHDHNRLDIGHRGCPLAPGGSRASYTNDFGQRRSADRTDCSSGLWIASFLRMVADRQKGRAESSSI